MPAYFLAAYEESPTRPKTTAIYSCRDVFRKAIPADRTSVVIAVPEFRHFTANYSSENFVLQRYTGTAAIERVLAVTRRAYRDWMVAATIETFDAAAAHPNMYYLSHADAGAPAFLVRGESVASFIEAACIATLVHRASAVTHIQGLTYDTDEFLPVISNPRINTARVWYSESSREHWISAYSNTIGRAIPDSLAHTVQQSGPANARMQMVEQF